MSLIGALLCEVSPTDEAAGVLVKKGLWPPASLLDGRL